MSFDPFVSVTEAPHDAIFKLTADYKADTFEKKVNLGVGAYRDDNGKPWVLPVVQKAKRILADDVSLDHEYLPITGLPEFTSASTKLILGADSPAIKEKRASAIQTISGTDKKPVIYVSKPTWANHQSIFKTVGYQVEEYPYYDPTTIALNYDGFLSALRNAPSGSVFLIHACAHNPTGVDPTKEQWKAIANAIKEKQHFTFFDCAYQGFASGDLDNDAWTVRYFVQEGLPLLICQSYAKNAGLYGERIGALTVVTPNEQETKAVQSQLALLARAEISNPPTFGARIVSMILNNPDMFEQWKVDIKTMADRIIDMRRHLHDLLINKYKAPGNWDHIVSQIGMFSFTGLNTEQVKAMVEKGHIYMTANGRISMAGLNSHNVEYVAECISKAARNEL